MKLEIVDGRGQERAALGKKNRADIIAFFEGNPDSTKTACAKNLGISFFTVLRHVKAINAE